MTNAATPGPVRGAGIRSLPLHAALAEASRLGAAAARIGGRPVAEFAVLVSMGVAAALLTLFVDLDLHLPGHAILRSVAPLALGLALVPRRYAGTVMGGAALAAVLAGSIGREGPGWGSTTSLVLTGPVLDLAVRRVRSGRAVYVALVAGGVATNLIAFAIRLGAKLVTHDGGSPLATWWPRALGTYTLCGVAAGIVSAALWFRFGARSDDR